MDPANPNVQFVFKVMVTGGVYVSNNTPHDYILGFLHPDSQITAKRPNKSGSVTLYDTASARAIWEFLVNDWRMVKACGSSGNRCHTSITEEPQSDCP
jgi:hypothetical protein